MESGITGWYEALREFIGQDPFFTLLEYAGTFAGAISGVRLASIKRFDWFGAFVIGAVTALGGGTLRDILLNIEPFWVANPSYIVVTIIAVVCISLFGRRFIDGQITWYVWDTLSISFFMVIGLEKTLRTSHSWWCALIMGVITAVFGGVLRDICINAVPLIFRKEIYALACALGGVVYLILFYGCGIDSRICATICVLAIFIIRALAIRYHLGVPVLKGRNQFAHHHNKSRPLMMENRTSAKTNPQNETTESCSS